MTIFEMKSNQIVSTVYSLIMNHLVSDWTICELRQDLELYVILHNATQKNTW